MSLKRPVTDVSDAKSPKSVKLQDKTSSKIHEDVSGKFLTNVFAPTEDELSCFPLVSVKDYGVLPLPLTKLRFNDLVRFKAKKKEKNSDSCFSISSSFLTVGNEGFSTSLLKLVESSVKPQLGLKGKTELKLKALFALGPSSNFNKVDTQDTGLITVVVQLPSIFTGGKSIVRHMHSKSIKLLSFGEVSGAVSRCAVFAYYADCMFCLGPVTTGYQVFLLYSLRWKHETPAPSLCRNNANKMELWNALNEYMAQETDMIFAWQLRSDSPHDQSCILKQDISEDSDRNILEALQEALEFDAQQFGQVRYELRLGTLQEKFEEVGKCTKVYPDHDNNDAIRQYRSGCILLEDIRCFSWDEDAESCEGNCDADWDNSSVPEMKLINLTSLENASESFDLHHSNEEVEKLVANFSKNALQSGKDFGEQSCEVIRDCRDCKEATRGGRTSRTRLYHKMALVVLRKTNLAKPKPTEIRCEKD